MLKLVIPACKNKHFRIPTHPLLPQPCFPRDFIVISKVDDLIFYISTYRLSFVLFLVGFNVSQILVCKQFSAAGWVHGIVCTVFHR